MKKLFDSQSLQTLDEIVFQHRNKNYGAYALRKEEGAFLGKAMFFGISIFVILGISPLLLSNLDSSPGAVPNPGTPPHWVPVEDWVLPDRTVEPPAVKPASPSVQTYDTSVPVPTQNAVERPVSTINPETAVPGLQDTPGEAPVSTYNPPATVQGPEATTPQAPAVIPDPKAIPARVDVMADFQGGIQAFRKKVLQNFDGSAYEGSGEKISAVVTFVVERDGSISAVKATGKDADFNREAEKAVAAARGKWKPAVLDGHKVRSYFRIPITMQFE